MEHLDVDMMAPIVSGSGLPKWIMQYGTVMMNTE